MLQKIQFSKTESDVVAKIKGTFVARPPQPQRNQKKPSKELPKVITYRETSSNKENKKAQKMKKKQAITEQSASVVKDEFVTAPLPGKHFNMYAAVYIVIFQSYNNVLYYNSLVVHLLIPSNFIHAIIHTMHLEQVNSFCALCLHLKYTTHSSC
jgi:hypothetical protein